MTRVRYRGHGLATSPLPWGLAWSNRTIAWKGSPLYTVLVASASSNTSQPGWVGTLPGGFAPLSFSFFTCKVGWFNSPSTRGHCEDSRTFQISSTLRSHRSQKAPLVYAPTQKKSCWLMVIDLKLLNSEKSEFFLKCSHNWQNVIVPPVSLRTQPLNGISRCWLVPWQCEQ